MQENADPAVRADLERSFAGLVRDGDAQFEHDDEGPDDMPAHIRAALTLTSLAVPVQSGAPTVGTWQAISVGEHRAHPHRRTIALHDAGT